MNPNTKLYKILKTIYFAEDFISAKDISKKTKIPQKQITPYTNRIGRVKKIKKDGQCYYKFNPCERDYLRNLMIKSENETQDESNKI